jgi:DNA-binding transcriptional MocR family regulator
MFNDLKLDANSEVPLYRQLSDAISKEIESGNMQPGSRLPATRELASRLNLNRTTISAAYSDLEQRGLLRGHVGRGSFVAAQPIGQVAGLDWESILPLPEPPSSFGQSAEISFANSRPADDGFPVAEFRRVASEVIDSSEIREILQLGSPLGYPPLRSYLLELARKEGTARPHDDLMITNGCQQALDLLARLFGSHGETVIVEDPVYRGLRKAFDAAGANVIPAPVGDHGVEPAVLEALIARNKPRAAVLTPSFQNPTGSSIPEADRARIIDIAVRSGVVLIESDIYTELRYLGHPAETLKRLDETGNVILLRSYSKVSFPGLRVGWVIAPRPVVQCLAELKQTSDLHSDQLSQAVLLRFAQSGALARHLSRTRTLGAARLSTALSACAQYLPSGTRFTRPEGGMNLWVELPGTLDARDLLMRAQEEGVNFLPGNYFSDGRSHYRCFRLSFGGLSPKDIERGIRILGGIAARELASSAQHIFEPAAALV